MFKLPKTEQEVFDTVARHLLTQNRKSVTGTGMCLYRCPSGAKCAAGVLIPDDFYHSKMETLTWEVLVEKGWVPAEHRTLIRILQHIHDSQDIQVSDWPERLRRFAEQRNLSTAVLDEFTK